MAVRTPNRFWSSLQPSSPFAIWVVLGTCVAILPWSAEGQGRDPNAKRIRHVAFSPDGKLLAACVGELEEPGHVTVWDIATGKSRWTHREKKGIPSVAFAPDGRTLAIAVLDENATLLEHRQRQGA